MRRTKFTVGMRNKLAMIAADMDCSAAVSDMTAAERRQLEMMIRQCVAYIDEHNH